MNAKTTTPAHLLPLACYVCGGAKHPPTLLHSYISNADALADVIASDRRTTAVFPSGATTAETHYVNQTRGA